MANARPIRVVTSAMLMFAASCSEFEPPLKDIESKAPTIPTTVPSSPSKGDVVPIDYNNKTFFLEIVETKPSNAISIVF